MYSGEKRRAQRHHRTSSTSSRNQIIRSTPVPSNISYTYSWSRTTTRPEPQCFYKGGCVRAQGSYSPLDWSYFKLGGKTAAEVEADARDQLAKSDMMDGKGGGSGSGGQGHRSGSMQVDGGTDGADMDDTKGNTSTGGIYKGRVMCVDVRSKPWLMRGGAVGAPVGAAIVICAPSNAPRP